MPGWRRGALAGLLAFGMAVPLQAQPPSGSPSAASALPAPRVNVTGGAIAGTRDSAGTLLFRTIPFAAPPLGPLRWKAPAPVHAWQGMRDASRPGPSCLQNDYGWNHADYVRASEDCLTLDVATPALSGGRPVMVWIHGGSNRAGSAGDTILSPLARRGVVLVAIQYRLGIFGFLAHRAAAEEAGGAAGNYGLMDQIAALRWVRANIARFGGDPGNVTIFGESAGAQDVGLLLASPETGGLFARAIMESGTPSFGLEWRPREEAWRLGDQLDALLGTHGDIAALRAASAHALLEADKALHDDALQSDDFLWLRSTIDGAVLPQAPYALLAKAPRRAVILGSNRAEFGLPDGRSHRDGNVDAAFGPRAALARAFYRLDEPDPPAEARLGPRDLRIATDILFRCPAGQLADLLAGAGYPVWRYEFDLAEGGGISFHGSDLPFVLGGEHFGPERLSLQDYWLDFAASADPNGAPDKAAHHSSRPFWPAYGEDKRHAAFNSTGLSIGSNLAATPCRWMQQP